jgi:hypothetical protein
MTNTENARNRAKSALIQPMDMKANQEMIACATSHEEVNWHAIDWHKVNQNVRRLQARIVKATRSYLL